VSEIGKSVSSVAESLKDNPSCLAAILLAAMFAVLTYFSMRQDREYYQERQMALIQRCTFTDPMIGNEPEFDKRRME
jgi:hypothetical protein